MKLNFSMLKNENIGFKQIRDNKVYSFCDELINVKQFKDHYEFLYENNKLVVENNVFMHLLFVKENDNYYFVTNNDSTINGLVGFTMSDTYGFPVELTEEIFEEKNMILDINGFTLIKELNRKKTQEKSKKTSAF